MKVQDVHYILKLRLINDGTSKDGEGMLTASPENDLTLITAKGFNISYPCQATRKLKTFMLRNIKQPNFRETHFCVRASISGPASAHSPYVSTTTISLGGTNGLLVLETYSH